MHQEAMQWVVSSTRGHWPRVLELGSRNINGSVRALFPASFFWGIDIREGDGVDEVADGATWQTAEPFDLVLCLEVFEHTPDWSLLVRTAARALGQGGVAVFTMATDPRFPHSAIDEQPIRADEFYQNVNPADLVIQLGQCFPNWTLDRISVSGDLRVRATR